MQDDADRLPRVLVIVRDGMVCYTADPGVDVVIVDRDDNPNQWIPDSHADLEPLM